MSGLNADRVTVETLRHEHAEWLSHFERWRAEHREALLLLAKVQAAILDRETRLAEQADAIREHERELQDYELIGSDTYAPDPEKELARHAVMLQAHEDARSEFQRTRERHGQLTKVVAKLSQLCQSSGL